MMRATILSLALGACTGFTGPSSAARPNMALKASTATLPATVKPGVVTGEALMDLLAYAKERGFAIPAVNAVSSCGINACLEAAAKRVARVLFLGAGGASENPIRLVLARILAPPPPAPPGKRLRTHPV